MWDDGWDSKSICLNSCPLVGRTGNKVQYSILLLLTLHRLPEVIILWGTSAGVREANNELTPGNVTIALLA